jgi:hypothetical protein
MKCQTRASTATPVCGKPAVHHFLVQRRDGTRETHPFKVPYILAWCGDCCNGTFDKGANGYNDTDSKFTCDSITPEEVFVFQIMES